jgi:hypothetical protein
MITVKFSSENELFDELKRDYGPTEGPRPVPLPHERPILRIAGYLKPASSTSSIHHFYLVATMINPRGQTLSLERFCGDIWHIEEQDKKTNDEADEVRAAIEKFCGDIGIDVRGGFFEVKQEIVPILSYLGNGIVIICDKDNHIFRSEDYGLTWIELGVLPGEFKHG